MANLMTLALFLYKKLRNAGPKTRERLQPLLDEMTANGAIPLGMRRNDAGEQEYWWLVYDDSRHGSAAALQRYLKERTPRDLKMVVLTI